MPRVRPEEWRPIAAAPGYDVSSAGRVRSWRVQGNQSAFERRKTPRILSLRTTVWGYKQVFLSTQESGQRIRRGFAVHRLVARAFLGEPPEGKSQVDHIDSDRTNNDFHNLRWVTSSENNIHRFVREGTRRIIECPHCGHELAIRRRKENGHAIELIPGQAA